MDEVPASETENIDITVQPLTDVELSIDGVCEELDNDEDDSNAEGEAAIIEDDEEDEEEEERAVGESGEPPMKRLRPEYQDEAFQSQLSIRQILFNINKAVCLRLDSIEEKLKMVTAQNNVIDSRLQQMESSRIIPLDLKPGSQPLRGGTSITNKRNNAVIIGLPQDKDLSGVNMNMMGSHQPYNSDGSMQNLGPNVTLITLNSEEDYPDGVWLGDENNVEMRVRVPISPSDMLHITSNCRTAEKMGLTLLDYLFDRNTQANSNLSGMGKHGKMQLDPLMVYGIRCHLIHRFGITEGDWHRIKQNVDSKCRTAWRRKQRGLPLTVKAFRGKQPCAKPVCTTTGLMTLQSHGLPAHLLPSQIYPQGVNNAGGVADSGGGGGNLDALIKSEEANELHIHQAETSNGQNVLSMSTAAEIISTNGGEIQVIHATPEQVAQLQQTHQIQILQGDQLMHLQPGDLQAMSTAMTTSSSSELSNHTSHFQVVSAGHGLLQVMPPVEEEVVAVQPADIDQ